MRDQVRNALSAAATAASTWAVLASGTWAIVSPVLAFKTGYGSPVPATNFAPINISVSSIDCPPLIAWFAGYFDDPPMCSPSRVR